MPSPHQKANFPAIINSPENKPLPPPPQLARFLDCATSKVHIPLPILCFLMKFQPAISCPSAGENSWQPALSYITSLPPFLSVSLSEVSAVNTLGYPGAKKNVHIKASTGWCVGDGPGGGGVGGS